MDMSPGKTVNFACLYKVITSINYVLYELLKK